MNKVLSVVSTVAAMMVASPSFAQDKTSNTYGGALATYGGASYEAVPYPAPAPRQFRPVSPRGAVTLRPRETRESGAQKRG